jgi:hypothetical protein
MNDPISRREAGRRFFLTSATLLAPAWLLACGKKELACVETTGLTADEIAVRTTTLAYVDKSPDPNKTCVKCQLYKPAAEGSCGACTVLKGPINPAGSCKSFAPKVT